MKEYKYDNAVVRITIPTKEQQENIRKATEVFLKKAVMKGLFDDGRTNKSVRRNGNNFEKQAK